jgi:hypothetical protein
MKVIIRVKHRGKSRGGKGAALSDKKFGSFLVKSF